MPLSWFIVHIIREKTNQFLFFYRLSIRLSISPFELFFIILIHRFILHTHYSHLYGSYRALGEGKKKESVIKQVDIIFTHL